MYRKMDGRSGLAKEDSEREKAMGWHNSGGKKKTVVDS